VTKFKYFSKTLKIKHGFINKLSGREESGWILTGLICLWIWTDGSYCESGNEPSGSINCEDYRVYLRRALHDGVNVRRYEIYFT
jgi:hypothetical protein